MLSSAVCWLEQDSHPKTGGVEFDATLKAGGMSVSNKIQPTVKEVKKDTAIIEVPEDQIVKMIW